jgi:hypothetical protein
MIPDSQSTQGYDKKNTLYIIWSHTRTDFLLEAWICRGLEIDADHYLLAIPFRIPKVEQKEIMYTKVLHLFLCYFMILSVTQTV